MLLGRNGAGKTTTLKTIMGLTPASKGSIHFQWTRYYKKATHHIANTGIGYVPEDQGIFGAFNSRGKFKSGDEKRR